MPEREWIGVDFDGTLAYYDDFKGINHLGDPIPQMVDRVKRWLSEGRRVKIFTARFSDPDFDLENMEYWCEDNIGLVLEVTNIKDQHMRELWDDRAIQVIPNTGMPVGKSSRGLD